ncbi:Ferredoxin [Variovorax sp. PBS-H4]|uniref:(2Fe-2S) ferredoxin domain-containing protein n=1 Tax=Variovorax sp. PBS-H4 TaxID=434008 RepID=UPI001316C015|nr:(2Fe-2S) ferredoxin domain-containing protein [Variovorax sp. PBS-H4]VTU37672.1 Ferredoxin [Variovorax sp. PBS-H4]
MSAAQPSEIYICNNTDCRSRGADRVLAALREACGAAVQVHTYMCFSACNSGPNVVIPQRRCWLSSVTPEDAAIVCAVVAGAEPPARLREKNDADLEALILGIIDAGLLAPEQ